MVFIKSSLLFFNHVIGFPRVAFMLEPYILLAVRVFRSAIHNSTPSFVVFVNAILDSSGEILKFESFGFNGKPCNCVGSLVFDNFKTLTFL